MNDNTAASIYYIQILYTNNVYYKMIKIIDVHNENDINKLNNAAKEALDNPKTHGLLVKLYANWCGYCKKMAADWDKLINELKTNYRCKDENCILTIANVEIQQLDDSDPIIRGIKHIPKDINGIPCIMYVSNGKRDMEYSGVRNYKNLLKWVIEHPLFGLIKNQSQSQSQSQSQTTSAIKTSDSKRISKNARPKFKLFHRKSLRRFHKLMKSLNNRPVSSRDPTPLRRVSRKIPAYLRI